MKRRLAFLSFVSLALSFSACDSIPDGVVDNKFVDYKVVKLESPSSFFYSNPDSLFTATVRIANAKCVDRVWLSVKSNDGSTIVHKQIFLEWGPTAAETWFAAKVPMSKKVSSGKFLVEFFVSDNIHPSPDNVSKVGEQVLVYNNNQTNYPPIISNLNMVQSIVLDKENGTPVKISITASDPNGLMDIAGVTYELYKPDGTKMVNSQGISQFPLLDDGIVNSTGDEKAGDGVYSYIVPFPKTASTGNWRFEFQAKDKSGEVSNVIKQTLVVN